MASGDKSAGRPSAGLLARLQRHIDTLDQIKKGGDTERLQYVIDELRKDIEDLEVVAPHVFILPRQR